MTTSLTIVTEVRTRCISICIANISRWRVISWRCRPSRTSHNGARKAGKHLYYRASSHSTMPVSFITGLWADMNFFCSYAYFQNLSQEDLPYIKIPLHTVIKLTPKAYGCDEERWNNLLTNILVWRWRRPKIQSPYWGCGYPSTKAKKYDEGHTWCSNQQQWSSIRDQYWGRNPCSLVGMK